MEIKTNIFNFQYSIFNKLPKIIFSIIKKIVKIFFKNVKFQIILFLYIREINNEIQYL